MVKRILKRIIAQILILLLICGMLPLVSPESSYAAAAEIKGSLSDSLIGLSAEITGGKGFWTADAAEISGEITGEDSCGTVKAGSTVLVISNGKSQAATLSFDYTSVLNGGKIVIDGNETTASGQFEKSLEPGESVKIAVTTKAGKHTSSVKLSGIRLLMEGNPEITFTAPKKGSYTVDEETIASETKKNKASSEGYALKAEPAEGYRFFGWYADGTFLSKDAAYTLYMDKAARGIMTGKLQSMLQRKARIKR